MRIWQQPISVETLTTFSDNSAVTHLGIEFFGLLHGGVSVVLAETLGSCASRITMVVFAPK
jgi:hypothetical protein